MEKKYLLSLPLCILLLAGACSHNPSVPVNEFLIQGQLENVSDSAVIELGVSDGQLIKTIAKDTLINGQFSLSDTVTSGKRELYLMSSSKGFPGYWLNVWVAPGKYIKITGKDKLLKTWTVKSDIPEQADENSFVQTSFPEQLDVLKYTVDEYDLIRTMFQEHAGNEELQKADWKQIDSLRKLKEPLEQIILKKELDYLKTAPISSVWLNKYLMHASRLQWDKENPYISEIKALYARLSDADKETATGKSISEYMNLGAEVNVGDKMIDGDLYDVEGNLRHLSEFAGQYILLDFWSQGCGPCVQSIPEMEEIIEMYKDKLAVVGISDDGKEDWKKYITQKKMSGNQWNELRHGRTGLAARYKVRGIPHYVLISPEGIIQEIWAGYGPGSLKSKLKDLMK